MRHNRVFFRTTRQRNVVQVLEEQYLRDDISCGCPDCTKCSGLTSPTSLGRFGQKTTHYAVLDTNVAAHQMDLLERPEGLADVVVPSTVVAELKHLDLRLHARLRAVVGEPRRRFVVFVNEHHRETFVDRLPAESPNDRNDRAVRRVCKWYSDHLEGRVPVVLVSDDRAQVARARKEGLEAYGVKAYISKYLPDRQSSLLDVVVREAVGVPRGEDAQARYEEHRPLPRLLQGVKAGELVQGVIHFANHNCLRGSVMGPEGHVVVQGRDDLNRAVEGDLVVVQTLPEDRWLGDSSMIVEEESHERLAEELIRKQKESLGEMRDDHSKLVRTGKVVGVVRRSWKQYCGSIEPPKSAEGSGDGPVSVLFRPSDKRVPRIRVFTRRAKALAGRRVVVAIDSWDRYSAYPAGHLVQDLGAIGERLCETEAIMLTNEVPHHPMGDAVLACLPPLPWKFDPARDMGGGRVDLRDRRICSVDPVGCKDIDDALHVRRLANGNFEVGVHIADVSHFVEDGTALDAEAAARGTTVYLADRRIDMLPKPLTEIVCSLVSNQDRLAFSALWELTPKADVVRADFCKSVIRSRRSFSYGEAQDWIDGKVALEAGEQEEIAQDLRDLMALAKQLKQKRIDAGALILSSAEVKFTKDADYQPVDVELYETHDTNSMVEEWMLMANVAVADKIWRHFPNYALLRRHQAPAPGAFDGVQHILASRGYPQLSVENSKDFGKSLDAVSDPKDPFINQLIRQLSTRCMMQAKYFSSGSVDSRADFRHYGLATDIYTHFTSPIRRYADLMVHRLLACALGSRPVNPRYSTTTVQRICDTLNRRHTAAQWAQRASTGLVMVDLFKGKTLVEPAYVTRVHRNGFMAVVPKYAVEGLVFIDRPETWEYDEAAACLKNPQLGITLSVLDRITVQMTVDESDPHEHRLRLACIEPALTAASPSKRSRGENQQQVSATTVLVAPTDKEAVACAGRSEESESTEDRTTTPPAAKRRKSAKKRLSVPQFESRPLSRQ